MTSQQTGLFSARDELQMTSFGGQVDPTTCAVTVSAKAAV